MGKGKFDNGADEYVFSLAMDLANESEGTEGTTYHGLVVFGGDEAEVVVSMKGPKAVGAIVTEDHEHFVSVEYYEDDAGLAAAWAIIRSAYRED